MPIAPMYMARRAALGRVGAGVALASSLLVILWACGRGGREEAVGMECGVLRQLENATVSWSCDAQGAACNAKSAECAEAIDAAAAVCAEAPSDKPVATSDELAGTAAEGGSKTTNKTGTVAAAPAAARGDPASTVLTDARSAGAKKPRYITELGNTMNPTNAQNRKKPKNLGEHWDCMVANIRKHFDQKKERKQQRARRSHKGAWGLAASAAEALPVPSSRGRLFEISSVVLASGAIVAFVSLRMFRGRQAARDATLALPVVELRTAAV